MSPPAPPPPAPPGIPPLGILDPPLAHAGAARAVPFRVAGRGVAVLGNGRVGVTASATGAGLVTGPIRLTAPGPSPVAAAAANLMQSPGLVRRELVVPGCTILETVVVPDRLAGFAVQWTRASAGPPVGPLNVEVSLPLSPAGALRWTNQGGTLRVAGPEGDETGCVLALDPPGDWHVEDHPQGLVARHTWRPPEEGAPLTLLVAAVDGAGRTPSLKALGALETHRRRLALRGRTEPGLRLETGVREMDDGVTWARAILESSRDVAAPPDTGPDPAALVTLPGGSTLETLLDPAAEAAWCALGALAVGDFRLARDLLPPPDIHPLNALARAEWMAWTGDPGPLRAARPQLDALLAAPDGPDDESRVRRLVRRRLGDAAEAAGEADWARDLRAGGPAPQGMGSGDSVRRLPTVAPGSGAASLLAAFLGDPDPGGAMPAATGADDAPAPAGLLLARAHYALGHPQQGLPALRQALGNLVREPPPVSPRLPALTLWTLVTGLLGARPDAAFGRLTLAPALPASWTGFTLRGLALGDGALDLAYRREGTRHEWRISPVGGAVPLMLIFAPSLALTDLASVRVDGRPAQVDVVRRGSRTTLRLQLPIDSDRSLTVEGS